MKKFRTFFTFTWAWAAGAAAGWVTVSILYFFMGKVPPSGALTKVVVSRLAGCALAEAAFRLSAWIRERKNDAR
ncbi:MAG: hypothetical protein ABW189_01565 [Rickettsiales bacterium]